MKGFTEISEAMKYVRVQFISLYFITLPLNFSLKKKKTPFHYQEWRTMGMDWLSTLYKKADKYFFMTTKSFGLNFKLINSKCNRISN